MKNKKRRTNKKRRLKILPIVILIVLLILIGFGIYKKIEYDKLQDKITKENNLIENIKSHYNEYVITTKETSVYDEDNNIIGKINKDIELSLEDVEIDKDTKYFKLKDFEGSYILYEDVKVIDKLTEINNRYQNYIPFNKNITTKEKTVFYNENNEYVYEINKSYEFKIIIKDTDRYGVEFNNRLLYIKSDNVEKVYDNHNTDKSNVTGIPVFNYHAFYDENNETERKECNTSICHSKKQFKTHLDYFKENNILTIKMNEMEMYLDGKIQLPKSVLLTIDDGGRTTHAINMLTEYQMYATIFLVTSWFDAKTYPLTEYIELHSHGHNLHNGGECPGGQGGAIKCLAKDKLLEDLATARSLLNNTTSFCYPFYEYNQYAINILKEAGFTMAFVGEEGDMIAHIGVNKYRIPRFVIMTHTTMNDIKVLFNSVR